MPQSAEAIKTATFKFDPTKCWRCDKSAVECVCEKNTGSLKNQIVASQKSGYPQLEMYRPQPPQVLLFLLSRAARSLRCTDGVTLTIYHWMWLDLHLDCGVWGDGGNAWYEWFVLEKLPDGSYRLETSNMQYGSTPYCLKTVLQKMDGRGCL